MGLGLALPIGVVCYHLFWSEKPAIKRTAQQFVSAWHDSDLYKLPSLLMPGTAPSSIHIMLPGFLPTNLLFNGPEIEKVNVLLRTERQRHRAWLKRIENSRR